MHLPFTAVNGLLIGCPPFHKGAVESRPPWTCLADVSDGDRRQEGSAFRVGGLEAGAVLETLEFDVVSSAPPPKMGPKASMLQFILGFSFPAAGFRPIQSFHFVMNSKHMEY